MALTVTSKRTFRPGVAPSGSSRAGQSGQSGQAGQAGQGRAPVPAKVAVAPAPLTPGAVVAKVIARIWQGGELTIVDSPPGAGKTELVTTTTAHLAVRGQMRVLIGTPTRAQGGALLERLVTQIPAKYLESGISGVEVPGGPVPKADREPLVRVSTLAKCRITKDRDTFQLLIVDEAYQATNAVVSEAAKGIGQVLMVGDPGQIGPVVTVDTSIWNGLKDAPHLPAAQCVGRRKDALRFHLDCSWRLGPQTVDAIGPIYQFPFTSAEIARQATTNSGDPLQEIESIEIPSMGGVDDVAGLTVVADRVVDLVGGTLTVPGQPARANKPAQPPASRTVEGSDIAVVVSRNSQVSIITGLLRERGVSSVLVGTADRLQGGEWPIVVALDAMSGSADRQTDHNQSVGRLCVMASRHNTHLSWVHDGTWRALRKEAAKAPVGYVVRAKLAGEILDG